MENKIIVFSNLLTPIILSQFTLKNRSVKVLQFRRDYAIYTCLPVYQIR